MKGLPKSIDRALLQTSQKAGADNLPWCDSLVSYYGLNKLQALVVASACVGPEIKFHCINASFAVPGFIHYPLSTWCLRKAELPNSDMIMKGIWRALLSDRDRERERDWDSGRTVTECHAIDFTSKMYRQIFFFPCLIFYANWSCHCSRFGGKCDYMIENWSTNDKKHSHAHTCTPKHNAPEAILRTKAYRSIECGGLKAGDSRQYCSTGRLMKGVDSKRRSG